MKKNTEKSPSKKGTKKSTKKSTKKKQVKKKEAEFEYFALDFGDTVSKINKIEEDARYIMTAANKLKFSPISGSGYGMNMAELLMAGADVLGSKYNITISGVDSNSVKSKDDFLIAVLEYFTLNMFSESIYLKHLSIDESILDGVINDFVDRFLEKNLDKNASKEIKERAFEISNKEIKKMSYTKKSKVAFFAAMLLSFEKSSEAILDTVVDELFKDE